MDAETRIIFPMSNHYKRFYNLKDFAQHALETSVLGYLMEATGISKLFSREDIYEFVFRLTLSYQYLQVEEMFFENECLITFRKEGRLHYLTTNDLANHIGLQITEFPAEPQNREEWLPYRCAMRENTTLPSTSLVDFIDPEGIAVLEYTSYSRYEIWLTREDDPDAKEIKNASIIAGCVTADIPEYLFERFRQNNSAFLEHLRKYPELINTAPPLAFEWGRLTENARDEVMKMLFRPVYHAGITLDEVCALHQSCAHELVYLAWLFANGFVWDAQRNIIDPRYKLNIQDMHSPDLDVDSDMKSICYIYNFEKVFHLLNEKIR